MTSQNETDTTNDNESEWNTDTTNDNESEWRLSMPNCDSSWKVIPRALFAMLRRFEQEYAAVLWHPVSSATTQQDGGRISCGQQDNVAL